MSSSTNSGTAIQRLRRDSTTSSSKGALWPRRASRDVYGTRDWGKRQMGVCSTATAATGRRERRGAERVRYFVSHTSARPMRAGCPDAARAPANCALRGCRVAAPSRRVQANLSGRCHAHGDMVGAAPRHRGMDGAEERGVGARVLWPALATACAHNAAEL